MFDIGFTRFITNTWISIIWTIAVILHFLAFLCGVFAFLSTTKGAVPPIALLALVAPLSLLFSRMALEFTIVVFRIESHLRAMREKSEEQRR